MNNEEYLAFNQKLATLLPKCARSDEQAFTDVYNLTSSNLFAVLVRSLGMNADAEHALQETYTKIWLRAADYHVELGSPITWLTSIARSHASQVLLARRSTQDKGVRLAGTQSAPTQLAQVTFLDKRDETKILEVCLNELDDKSRDCIVRAYLEGVSLQELSEMHNTSIESVQSLISQSVMSMKGCVNGLS